VHEYSVVQALMEQVEAVARQRGAASVARVRLAIGEQAGIESALLESAFDLVRTGTLCANATLELRSVPARWSCRGCGRAIARGALLACPDCGSPATLVGGGEMIVEPLELEVA